jgi:hypothetical protein
MEKNKFLNFENYFFTVFFVVVPLAFHFKDDL